jgi:hypothetical protein
MVAKGKAEKLLFGELRRRKLPVKFIRVVGLRDGIGHSVWVYRNGADTFYDWRDRRLEKVLFEVFGQQDGHGTSLVDGGEDWSFSGPKVQALFRRK